ncbi:MAG: efflux RND transporter periplasmic adaptor subunit [Terriglobales bacterium]
MESGKRGRWAAAAIALAVAGTGCSAGGNDNAASKPVVAVQVAPASRGALEQWVRVQAVLYPRHQAIITPKISAPVSQFFVNRGDHVQAGELLAQLENRDLKAAADEAQGQYEAAQAAYQTATAGAIPADLKKAQLDATAAQQAYANAQRIYDSRLKLYNQGAVPQRDLGQAAVDLTNAKNASELAQQHLQATQAVGHTQALRAAQADLATAQARAAAAAAQLDYSEIHSPIPGVITDRPVYPGELATTSAPLMTIMDLSQVVARAHLPADQAALLRVGDAATLTAAGGAPIAARVTVVSPATDPGSTTIEVWVQATNPGERLRPGTTVTVAALARTIKDAVIIPAGALLTDPTGATSVMVVGSDSTAHEREVEVGVREADRVQIVKGVQPGERVVTVGAYGLADNTRVTIESAPAGEAPDKGGT